MKMKEIIISRYGPLRDINLDLKDGIQPVYGPNESGKTLLVECLMRIFGGEDISLPEGAERVDEKPEGYVIVEMKGEEKKITFDNPLCSHLSVEPDELTNTLVVRNANLRIEAEDKFYERVSDKLSGLWTEGIRKIEGELKDLGRLTNGLSLSNRKGFNKPKDQLEDARNLKKDLKEYLERAEEEGISELEAQKFSAESKLKRLEKEKDKLEFGKLVDAYEKASEAHQQINQIPSEDLISDLNVQIANSKDLLEDKTEFERNLGLFKNLSIVSGIGAAISFLGLLAIGATSTLSVLVPGIFLLITAISTGKYLQINSSLSKIEKNVREITSKAKEAGLELKGKSSEMIGEIDTEIEEINQKREEQNRKLNQNIGVLKNNLDLDKDLENSEILSRASELIEKKKSELSIEGGVSYDESDKKEVEKELESASNEMEKLEESLKEHNKKLRDFSDQASNLDFKHFLGEELNVEIDNLESLNILIRELDRFIQRIKNDKENSELAVKIFRNLKSEEEEKISDLFGDDSETSEIFEEITDGRYTRVDYDQDKEEIFVEKPTGEVRYPSRELCGSRGTVDQLYLTIRMALARKILENPPFFVLDDALLFSDDTRTERQQEILSRFSEMGCQVLYFTSTETVADNLSELSGNPSIELSRLP